MKRPDHRLWIPLALGLLLAAACSPEATRTRAGGPGGDVGNRALGPSLNIHGPTDPMFDTPAVGRAVEGGK